MRIAVMGAGAVGCYFGGLLARAGHAVTLIARPEHVSAITQHGLRFETREGLSSIALAASTEARAAADAQLVLCCVKSNDTAEAAAQLAPYLAPDAVVLSLQNGVDNAARLTAQLPQQQVIAAVVYVATDMAGPGHVRHHGRGELVIGPSPASERLATLFAAAGVPTQVSDQVEGALWAKLVINCAYNALSALTQLPYAQLVQAEGVEAVMRDAVQECLAVAQASGVTVPGDVWADVQRIARTMPDQRSSTAQDLARGRRSEIDHLNGYVVRQGAACGVPTPANRVLHTLVKLREASPG